MQFLSRSYTFLLTVKYKYDVQYLFNISIICDKKLLKLCMCNAVQTNHNNSTNMVLNQNFDIISQPI